MSDSDDLGTQLHTEIEDYLEENSTRFETAEHKFDTGDGVVDVYLETRGGTPATVMVDQTDGDELDRDTIKQARDGVMAMDGSLFAILTDQNIFVFDYDNEIEISNIDCYRYGLQDCDSPETMVPILLAAIHAQQFDYNMTLLSGDELDTYI